MDEIKIEESPKIPSEITNSANLEKLCIFMGAGCSQLLDCPSWESLAKELVNSCYDCQELDFDFQDSKVLLDTQSPKEIITICKNLLSEKGLENRFENKIRESLKYNLATEDLDYNIYKKLTRLSKRNITFVTTNVDNHFSRFPEIDVEFENFTNYRPNTLYCIHGHIQKPESMIFTVKDYLNKYKTKSCSCA